MQHSNGNGYRFLFANCSTYHGVIFVLLCVPVLFANSARCQFVTVWWGLPLALLCFSLPHFQSLLQSFVELEVHICIVYEMEEVPPTVVVRFPQNNFSDYIISSGLINCATMCTFINYNYRRSWFQKQKLIGVIVLVLTEVRPLVPPPA